MVLVGGWSMALGFGWAGLLLGSGSLVYSAGLASLVSVESRLALRCLAWLEVGLAALHY